MDRLRFVLVFALVLALGGCAGVRSASRDWFGKEPAPTQHHGGARPRAPAPAKHEAQTVPPEPAAAAQPVPDPDLDEREEERPAPEPAKPPSEPALYDPF